MKVKNEDGISLSYTPWLNCGRTSGLYEAEQKIFDSKPIGVLKKIQNILMIMSNVNIESSIR